ncbi:MAG TPA: hypothetical protein VMR21_01790 [Vicinamibacteria bacterium]|nr:hypothetical protein [Vicinamibacteria bacterium]
MGALGLLPVVVVLAGSGFLPGSGGVESVVPPVRAVLRARSMPEGATQVPAILLVRRGARMGIPTSAERCAVRGHGHEVRLAPPPGSGRPPAPPPGRRPPSRRDDPTAERPPPSPIS